MTNATIIPSRRIFGCLAIAALATAVFVAPSQADQPPGDDVINAELFAAIDAGQVDVKFIPKDAKQANVLFKNLTDKPLHIALPAAFAGVPVQAQMMGGGMGGGGMGGMGGMGGGGGQGMGGGMGGGGMGGGGMGGGGMGGGFMRIPPERMKKMQVTTVCLEHGKPDPNPKMAYKIVPIEQFTKNAEVHVICEALGKGMVTQNTAQAAAWHLMDKMSWDELAKKNRVQSQYTGNVPFFSAFELRTANAVVSEAKRIAAEYAKNQAVETTDTKAADYEG